MVESKKGKITMTYDKWLILDNELWKLKAKCYDVEDEKTGIVLSRLCSMMQEFLSYIPKEDNNDKTNYR